MRFQSLSSTLPAACIALALGANPVFAGDDATKPKHQGERHQKLLEQFDSNHDGKLDDTERAAARAACAARVQEKHPEIFKQLDTDLDGKLSKEELQAGREKLRELREKQGDKRGNKLRGKQGNQPGPRQD